MKGGEGRLEDGDAGREGDGDGDGERERECGNDTTSESLLCRLVRLSRGLEDNERDREVEESEAEESTRVAKSLPYADGAGEGDVCRVCLLELWGACLGAMDSVSVSVSGSCWDGVAMVWE
tara:strand:- start:10176 stop:10538 length:363 start_codon:yes stop_codon:yes gene_type:complete